RLTSGRGWRKEGASASRPASCRRAPMPVKSADPASVAPAAAAPGVPAGAAADAGLAVAVIGLGYVGLPLAVALAASRDEPVIGSDVAPARTAELRGGRDRTGEIAAEMLAASRLTLADEPKALDAAGILIVTVPTPVDAGNRPDLAPVR